MEIQQKHHQAALCRLPEITEDKYGDPVTPHVNWKKALPKKPNEDEQRAFESLYEASRFVKKS